MRYCWWVVLILAIASVCYTSSSPPTVVIKLREEPTPSVFVQFIQGSKDEADSQPYVFRIMRIGDFAKLVRVWLTSGGTMTLDEDYVALSKWVDIPVGKATLEVHIEGIDDDVAEGVETLELSASFVPSQPRLALVTQMAK